MKIFKSIFWGYFLIIGTVLHVNAKSTVEDKVYNWLLNQQNENTGLLGNQESDNFSGIYSNALAAVCFVHKGEMRRAEKIFDFFQKNFYSEFSSVGPSGFHQFWDASSGTVHPDTDQWVGDNAWLLIALNFYQNKTKNGKYDAMRDGITQWIISLQDEDGGIKSGFNTQGPINSKSTEGNLDCFAALVRHPVQKKKILKYLQEKMWVEKDKRFKMGSTVDKTPLDSCAWGIGALGKEYRNTIEYIEKKFVKTVVFEKSAREVTGFSDLADKNNVWFEGTGEMTVAYHVVGETEKAEKYLKELEKAMIKSEIFENSVGVPCLSDEPAWHGATEKIFVPSQCWYLFGIWKLNPMSATVQD